MSALDHYYAKRGTRRELQALGQAEILARARRDMEARAHAETVANQEKVRFAQANFRIKGVYDLAEYAVGRATGLDRLIAAQSHGNEHLEAIHRTIEETAAIVTGIIIHNYGTARV